MNITILNNYPDNKPVNSVDTCCNTICLFADGWVSGCVCVCVSWPIRVVSKSVDSGTSENKLFSHVDRHNLPWHREVLSDMH